MGMINYVGFKIPPFLLVYTAVLTRFLANTLLICVPLKLKSFNCRQDVSSVPIRNRDASGKPQG